MFSSLYTFATDLKLTGTEDVHGKLLCCSEPHESAVKYVPVHTLRTCLQKRVKQASSVNLSKEISKRNFMKARHTL
jgi:hypothetical protein